MAGFRIQCPLCKQDFAVPTEVVEVNPATNMVTVVVDRTDLYGHQQQCAKLNGAPPPSPTKVIVLRGSSADVRPIGRPTSDELAGRIHQMLDMRAYVATGGSRACTMCGANGADCLEQLSKNGGTPCCSACGNGNSHPAPDEHSTCAEWAQTSGAKN